MLNVKERLGENYTRVLRKMNVGSIELAGVSRVKAETPGLINSSDHGFGPSSIPFGGALVQARSVVPGVPFINWIALLISLPTILPSRL